MLALGNPAVLRDPGQGGPGSSPGLGLSPQPEEKQWPWRHGPGGVWTGKGGTRRTQARPHPPRSPASWGGHTGRAPSGTRCEERPSPNLYPPSHTPPTGAGQLQPKREESRGGREKRIKSTMKRHNKHQLYPKSGAASFQQTSGCRGAALLLRTPIINLGEGGVGGTFPPSFPFVPLPRSAPRRKRCSPGCRRGAAPRRRAGREGKQGGRAVQGRGRRAEKRGCRCPSARAAAGHGRTRTPTFCVW